MRNYELMVVLSPILSAEEVADSKDRNKGLIDQQGGTITREDQWGMRRLAYPIRKAGQTFLEGNYVLTHFATEGVLSRTLEGQLNLSEDVLRYLVVKSEPPKPSQAAAVQEAPSAPDGAGDDGAVASVAVVDQAISDDVSAAESAAGDPAPAEPEGDAPGVVEDAPVAAVEEAPIDETTAVEDVEAAVPEADTDSTENEDTPDTIEAEAPEASIEEPQDSVEDPVSEGGNADSMPDDHGDETEGAVAEGSPENVEDGETRP
ncbi:MAG: 30S ribosomal protein S6 [Dehalococcoidia bacterium]|nr:30S ribosomal protein S6 [Dehalococcoidia bacterium]